MAEKPQPVEDRAAATRRLWSVDGVDQDGGPLELDRLIHERQTYVVPGDHFGLDHYLRISYGLSDEYVNEGLRRVYVMLISSE